MKFPQDCTTNEKKYHFVCRVQREARILYNKFSKWADVGITRSEYDQIPAKIKEAYPYMEKLSKDNWQKFFSKFRQLSNEIAEELCTQRASIEDEFAAQSIDIDLGEVSDAFGKL